MTKLACLSLLVFTATLSALQPGTIEIDSQEWKDRPIRHLAIRGTLNGDTDFNILLPERGAWEERALHWISGGTGANMNGHNGQSLFALTHGAAFVESTQGHRGKGTFEDDDTPEEMQYGASYSVMQYAKSRCVELYGREPRFTYVFGTSAGALKTSELLERFPKVYDGAVASTGAGTWKFATFYSSLFEYYRPLLQSKADALQAAVGVNSEGDPFEVLSSESQKDALRMVLQAGLPKIHIGSLRSPFALNAGRFTAPRYKQDPSYYEDFWKYGYGGDEAERQVVEGVAGIVAAVDSDQQRLKVEHDGARRDLTLFTIQFTSGALSGKVGHVRSNQGNEIVIRSGVEGVKPGDRFELDNRDLIAFLHYHRHIASPEGPGTEQFYKQRKPLHPQRSKAEMLHLDSSDHVVGDIKGKMIVVLGTEDRASWPTLGARYHALVRQRLGSSIEEHFRIYWVERGDHLHWWAGASRPRSVSNAGTNFKALEDLMAWVEQGSPPRPSTSYRMDELGQIALPPTAEQRKGYQPVIQLRANGLKNRLEAAAGKKVTFEVQAEDPDNSLVRVEMDFDGDGQFDQSQIMSGRKASAEFTFQYGSPGEYIAAARVTDSTVTQGGGIANLDAIRVTVD